MTDLIEAVETARLACVEASAAELEAFKRCKAESYGSPKWAAAWRVWRKAQRETFARAADVFEACRRARADA